MYIFQDGCSGDDSGKDNFDRDERRLMELGRRTVEMFVLGHLFRFAGPVLHFIEPLSCF
jgi:hypothetical protein